MDTPPPPPPPFTPPPRPGWWSRNWKWFVPMGCLTMIACVVVFIAAIFIFVFSIIKSAEPYKVGLQRAKNDPAVIAALGTPIKEGWFVGGNTNVDGASGSADMSIPISGPKGKGTVYVVAKKSAGQWDYEKLVVEIDKTKERISLTAPAETD